LTIAPVTHRAYLPTRTRRLVEDGRVDVKEVLLPGVGLRFEFNTRGGDSIVVIVRRSGDFEIVVHDADAPDQPRQALRLADEEAYALAQILGAPRIAQQFADLTREVPGLHAGKILVGPESPVVDRPLGATRARTRTGASIVAIVREDQIFASPGPTEILCTGDVLVVIGTEDGIAGVKRIVDEG
jgi:TrkA domain protein